MSSGIRNARCAGAALNDYTVQVGVGRELIRAYAQDYRVRVRVRWPDAMAQWPDTMLNHSTCDRAG